MNSTWPIWAFVCWGRCRFRLVGRMVSSVSLILWLPWLIYFFFLSNTVSLPLSSFVVQEMIDRCVATQQRSYANYSRSSVQSVVSASAAPNSEGEALNLHLVVKFIELQCAQGIFPNPSCFRVSNTGHSVKRASHFILLKLKLLLVLAAQIIMSEGKDLLCIATSYANTS